jgi:hypothetical protein
LWEKVAIGGLRPPFFDRTPMLRIGYAQSATDEGFASAERTPHPPSLREGTLSHKGRGKKAGDDVG